MKKAIKSSLYIIAVVVIAILAFVQLKSNKANNAEIAELANVKGKFYPVKVQKVVPSKLNNSITTTGFLQSETDLTIVSETQGRIIEIYKEKGDYVKAGDVIAKVDDELRSAQLSATKAAYEQLQKEVERFKTLYEKNAVTNQKFEEIKLNLATTKSKYISSKRQFDDTKIKSPVNGYIENDFIELGQFIGGGAKICTIIDDEKLYLKVEVSEQDYRNVKVGLGAEITSAAYPKEVFKGTIAYIGQKAGYANSFDLEVRLKQDEKLLKTGMFATAKINIPADSLSFFVPRKAIVGSLKEADVYIVSGDKVNLTSVITGNIIDGQVQIVKGIESGDMVVVEGNYNIYDHATVKIMNE